MGFGFNVLRFEKFIQENKDWNSISFLRVFFGPASRNSSKRTRIETRKELRESNNAEHDFEKFIQENKDWNMAVWSVQIALTAFEKFIQENKDWNFWNYRQTKGMVNLREIHPREQGLKQELLGGGTSAGYDFEKFIQENKDWNPKAAG